MRDLTNRWWWITSHVWFLPFLSRKDGQLVNIARDGRAIYGLVKLRRPSADPELWKALIKGRWDRP